MSFAFVLLAFSIAWGAIYQPLSSRLDTAELDGAAGRSIHFPADRPAIVEVRVADSPVVEVRAAERHNRTWATALSAAAK